MALEFVPGGGASCRCTRVPNTIFPSKFRPQVSETGRPRRTGFLAGRRPEFHNNRDAGKRNRSTTNERTNGPRALCPTTTPIRMHIHVSCSVNGTLKYFGGACSSRPFSRSVLSGRGGPHGKQPWKSTAGAEESDPRNLAFVGTPWVRPITDADP